MRITSYLFAAALLLAVGVFAVPAAHAANDCVFNTSGSTMKLMNDCTTDATILIPDGFLLDGNSHSITAVDPDGGHFLGAVVMNAGSEAHVKDLSITTDSLANVCDGSGSPDNRLRGILFLSASGSIRNNEVLAINQGASGCQEGNAIEVRNAPFDGTHPDTQEVLIVSNVVSQYQKGGIVANGDVLVAVKNNNVTGLGPVNYIAQNGVQLGFGAAGVVSGNTISGNQYTPMTFGSGGILLYAVEDGVVVKQNTIDGSDVGIWMAGASDAYVKSNVVSNSTFDGIALDDQGGDVADNNVRNNVTEDNDSGIGLYGSATTNNNIQDNSIENNTTVGLFSGFGAFMNRLFRNIVSFNLGDGIVVDADSHLIDENQALNNAGIGISVSGEDNVVTENVALDNGVSDIENVGDNEYEDNVCDTSSGAPVDCGGALLLESVETLPTTQAFE